MKNRKKLFWLVLLILVLSAALVGCQKPSRTSQTKPGIPGTIVATSREQQAISQIITAMGTVNSYKLDTDLIDTYTVVNEKGNPSTSIQVWQWKAQRFVNLAGEEIKISMDVRDGAHPAITPYVWQEYLIGGWLYYSQSSPEVFGMANPWTKTEVTEQTNWLWTDGTQMVPQIETLETATRIDLVGSEKVGNVNCDMLRLVPSAEAAADWVLAQNQGGSGPSTGWWKTSVETSKAIYIAAYQSGTARVWADANSHRILKLDVTLSFDVRPGNVLPSDTGMDGSSNNLGFDHIMRDFQGQWDFSEYDQPISIELPPAALIAPER